MLGTEGCLLLSCRSRVVQRDLPLSGPWQAPPQVLQAVLGWRAGTSAQINPSEAPRLHARLLQQLLRLHPDAWPPAVQTYKSFCQAAELVQSRAFHLNAHNFVSLQETEGALPAAAGSCQAYAVRAWRAAGNSWC